MTNIILLIQIAFLSFVYVIPQPDTMNDLIGVWEVDLTAAPGAEPASTYMEISQVKGNRVYGTFYGSEIESGYINTNWNRTVVSFITRDQTNQYFTSFTVRGDGLEGSTMTPGRDFLSVWTAQKK